MQTHPNSLAEIFFFEIGGIFSKGSCCFARIAVETEKIKTDLSITSSFHLEMSYYVDYSTHSKRGSLECNFIYLI